MQYVTGFRQNDLSNMEKDLTLAISSFRDLSSKIYEKVFTDFKKGVNDIDRQTDENVFQQLQARYIRELEKYLDKEAKRIIEAYTDQSSIKKLQRELSGHISYLVTAFFIKAKSM